MDLLTVSTLAGGFAATLVVLGALARAVQMFLVRPLRKLVRANEDFREDWYGQTARTGHASVPGVLDRLAAIEAEFQPDHGSSLRDAIDRVERRLDAHIAQHDGSVSL